MAQSILPESPQSSISTSPDSSSKKRKRTSRIATKPTTSEEPELEIDVNAPEPPSKKDLRKLKKLKSKGVDTEALTSLNVPLIDRSKKGAQEGETPAGTTANSAKRSPYGIWIGNLTFGTTRDDILRFLTNEASTTSTGNEDDAENKDVEKSSTGIRSKDITRLHVPKSTKFPKQNKGFAYVDFTTAAPIGHALALSEKLLLGRKVLIKASTDFGGRPEVTKEAAAADDANKNPPSKSVFVGNLGYEVIEDELYRHFSPAGKIKKVRFMTFEDTGKCKGFAWVDFEELKSAQNVFSGDIDGAKDEDDDEDESSGSEEEGRSKKRRKADGKKEKKQKRRKSNPYTFLKNRKLRLEYGEDATTRYKKRHGAEGKPSQESGDAKDKPSTSSRQKGNDMQHRKQRKEKELNPEEKMAKMVESRLTGRIVEATGKKTTFE